MDDPITPGEILLEDYLKPMGISQNAMARAIGVAPRAINEIVHYPCDVHSLWRVLRPVRRILARAPSRVRLSQTGPRQKRLIDGIRPASTLSQTR